MKINEIIDYKDRVINWSKHPASESYWLSNFNDKIIYLRMNNFPEESLNTLITNKQIQNFDDLPENWFLE